MAASLLLAFVGGIALQGGFASRPSSTSTQLAQQDRGNTNPVPQSSQGGPRELAANLSGEPAWQTYELRTLDGTQVEFQALDGSKHDPRFLLDASSAIPTDVLAQLEERGYRVQREKQLWPSQLEDGSRVIVPIEQVQLHYVGNSAYQ
jgi:hypothetical protein